MTQTQAKDLTSRFQTVTDSLDAFSPIEGKNASGVATLEGVNYSGTEYKVTDRFMKSMENKFKLSRSIFRYFSPEEVVGRVMAVNGREPVKVTIDHESRRVLGITDLKTTPIPVATTLEIIESDPRFKSRGYSRGVITGEFRMDDIWQIPRDSDYQQCFQLKVPVDGLTRPLIQIGLRRLVCENGQWSDVAAFKSDIAVGENPAVPLRRILKSYNNEEGFQSVRERLTKAGQTRASLDEVYRLSSLVDRRVEGAPGQLRQYMDVIHEVSGSPCQFYEVTSMKSLPKKKRQMLPVHCSVLDLINFSTEFATHHAKSAAASASFQGFVGKLITNEYDLEEVYEFDQLNDHKAFYVGVPSSHAN